MRQQEVIMFRINETITDPKKLFREPHHVLENKELSVQEKISILEDWKLDLIELQTATEENMSARGQETDAVADDLQAVIEALRLIQGG